MAGSSSACSSRATSDARSFGRRGSCDGHSSEALLRGWSRSPPSSKARFSSSSSDRIRCRAPGYFESSPLPPSSRARRWWSSFRLRPLPWGRPSCGWQRTETQFGGGTRRQLALSHDAQLATGATSSPHRRSSRRAPRPVKTRWNGDQRNSHPRTGGCTQTQLDTSINRLWWSEGKRSSAPVHFTQDGESPGASGGRRRSASPGGAFDLPLWLSGRCNQSDLDLEGLRNSRSDRLRLGGGLYQRGDPTRTDREADGPGTRVAPNRRTSSRRGRPKRIISVGTAATSPTGRAMACRSRCFAAQSAGLTRSIIGLSGGRHRLRPRLSSIDTFPWSAVACRRSGPDCWPARTPMLPAVSGGALGRHPGQSPQCSDS